MCLLETDQGWGSLKYFLELDQGLSPLCELFVKQNICGGLNLLVIIFKHFVMLAHRLYINIFAIHIFL